MSAHCTTAEAVKQAIDKQTEPGDIALLKSIHNPDLEAAARSKATALHLRLAVVHLAPVWPDLIRYRFYSNGVEPSAEGVG